MGFCAIFWGSFHVGGRSLDLANLFYTGLFAQRWPFYWHIELVEALVSKCVAKSYFSGFPSFPLACFGTGGEAHECSVALVTCVERIVLMKGMREGRREIVVL